MPTTFDDLPYEIVLKIVQWNARIVQEEQSRAHLAAENLLFPPVGPAADADGVVDGDAEALGELMDLEGGAGGPMIDTTIPPQGAGGGQAQAPPNVGGAGAGIGDLNFMQNLFGALGGGGGGGGGGWQTAPPAQNNANNGNNPPVPAAGANGPAGQPGEAVAGNGVGNAEAAANHPHPLQTLLGIFGLGNPFAGGAATAQPAPPPQQEEDEEMPPLEPLNSSASGPSTTTSEPASIVAVAPSSPQGSVPTEASTSAAAIEVAGGPSQDESMPALEPLPGTGTIPGQEGLAPPPSGTPSEDEEMPALEPTVPAAFHAVFGGGVATGNLVDIEPEAPQTAAVEANLVLAGIEAQGQGAVTVESDEEWEDEEEDEDDAASDAASEMDADEHAHQVNGAVPALETVAGVDPSTFSYKDGLPSDPLLPLALVNRSFLNAARSILYGSQILLTDMYQAYLLHRTLTSPTVAITTAVEEPEADDEESRQRGSLAYMVRRLHLDIRKTVSLGRGGGSVIVDLINLCTRLEVLLFSLDWTRSSFDPLRNALLGCKNMRVLALKGGESSRKEIVWNMSHIQPMLSAWKHLEDLQLYKLQTVPDLIREPLGGSIRKLSLAHPDITDEDLLYLLKNSKDVLDVLELHEPSSKISRLGLARALRKYGSALVNLQIDIGPTWHPTNAHMPPATSSSVEADVAASSRYLMDGLIGWMPKLEQLKLSGSLASHKILLRLPKTVEVLAFEDNPGMDITKVNAFLKKKRTLKNPKTGEAIKNPKTRTSKTGPAYLPKLQCFTLARRDGRSWSEPQRRELNAITLERKVCLHWTYLGNGGPQSVWGGGMLEGGAEDHIHFMGGVIPFPFPAGPPGMGLGGGGGLGGGAGGGDGGGGPAGFEEFMDLLMFQGPPGAGGAGAGGAGPPAAGMGLPPVFF